MLQKNTLTPLARTLAGLGLALSLSLAAAAPQQVEESVSLPQAPAKVWTVIGDYAGLAAWHPAVAKTTITRGSNNQKGAIRRIETKDGAVIVEELLARKDKQHSLTYRIVESPLPLKDYVSTLSVKAEGQGSRVVWQSHFTALTGENLDEAKIRGIVAGIYRAGLDELAKH